MRPPRNNNVASCTTIGHPPILLSRECEGPGTTRAAAPREPPRPAPPPTTSHARPLRCHPPIPPNSRTVRRDVVRANCLLRAVARTNPRPRVVLARARLELKGFCGGPLGTNDDRIKDQAQAPFGTDSDAAAPGGGPSLAVFDRSVRRWAAVSQNSARKQIIADRCSLRGLDRRWAS